MWKETSVVEVEVLARYLHEGAEGNYEIVVMKGCQAQASTRHLLFIKEQRLRSHVRQCARFLQNRNWHCRNWLKTRSHTEFSHHMFQTAQ